MYNKILITISANNLHTVLEWLDAHLLQEGDLRAADLSAFVANLFDVARKVIFCTIIFYFCY
jgi:hypothetical protein